MKMNTTRSALLISALSIIMLHGCQNGSDTHIDYPSSSSSDQQSSSSTVSQEQSSSLNSSTSIDYPSSSSSDQQSSSSTVSQEQSSSSHSSTPTEELSRTVIDASALVRANTEFNSDLYKGLKCKKRTHPATRDVLIRPPMTFSFGHQKRC